MTFIQCVTRIMQSVGIIRGDTDAPTSFSNTQHNASMQVAQVAIQNELVSLISNKLIPKERSTSGSITLVAGTRVYSLATDFIRFYGSAHLYSSSRNLEIFEYPGGLPKLQTDVWNYSAYPGQKGDPSTWYLEPGNTTYKQVGLFQIPQAADTLTYDYEASVLVSSASDSLPFHNSEEAYMFTDMASRRFKYMWEDVKGEADIGAILSKDMSYREAKVALFGLLKPANAVPAYGNRYA